MSPSNNPVDRAAVTEHMHAFQDALCARLESFEPNARFRSDRWARAEGGGGDTRVLANGATFEQAGVNFSQVQGDNLPASASARRPELAGRSFTATGVSTVIHPRNPHVPTSHANIRLFVAEKKGEEPVWWFGGGFDLTPCYGYREDAIAWHQAACDACAPYGDAIYPRFKRWCDDYFHLRHRGENRGIGGLFFDDFNELGFERSFAFVRAVSTTFTDAYAATVDRRQDTPWGEREREFQLYRRGRYVEFNLVYDRGTLFGLQSDGRTESILMSLPPLAAWQYDRQAEPGSPEAQLTAYFLKPQDWLAEAK